MKKSPVAVSVSAPARNGAAGRPGHRRAARRCASTPVSSQPHVRIANSAPVGCPSQRPIRNGSPTSRRAGVPAVRNTRSHQAPLAANWRNITCTSSCQRPRWPAKAPTAIQASSTRTAASAQARRGRFMEKTISRTRPSGAARAGRRSCAGSVAAHLLGEPVDEDGIVGALAGRTSSTSDRRPRSRSTTCVGSGTTPSGPEQREGRRDREVGQAERLARASPCSPIFGWISSAPTTAQGTMGAPVRRARRTKPPRPKRASR